VTRRRRGQTEGRVREQKGKKRPERWDPNSQRVVKRGEKVSSLEVFAGDLARVSWGRGLQMGRVL
jgi:hypothetical protein